MECSEPGTIRDEELLAYLAGERVRPAVEQHLGRCQRCSAQLAEYRRIERTLVSKLYRWDCPSNLTLGEYQLGLLDKEDVTDVKLHLSQCVLCAAEVATLTEYLANDPMLVERAPLSAVPVRPSSLNNHRPAAQEVDRETFFHTRESGGTVISSAYELCNKIINEEYPQELWNIYVFHFSDGDNWSGGDTDRCIHLLKTDLLPKVNLFGYGQVESTYGSGQFIRELDNNITDIDNLVLSRIENKEDIYQSIKDFLGKGK